MCCVIAWANLECRSIRNSLCCFLPNHLVGLFHRTALLFSMWHELFRTGALASTTFGRSLRRLYKNAIPTIDHFLWLWNAVWLLAGPIADNKDLLARQESGRTLDEAVAKSVSRRLRSICETGFAENVADVTCDCVQANDKVVRNLLIALARGYQA